MIKLPIGGFEFGNVVLRIVDCGSRTEDWGKKLWAKKQSSIQNHRLVIISLINDFHFLFSSIGCFDMLVVLMFIYTALWCICLMLLLVV